MHLERKEKREGERKERECVRERDRKRLREGEREKSLSHNTIGQQSLLHQCSCIKEK